MRFSEFGQGVYPKSRLKPLKSSNISKTGTHVARFQRKNTSNPAQTAGLNCGLPDPALPAKTRTGTDKLT